MAIDGNPLSELDISRCPDLTTLTALRCAQLATIYVAPAFTRQTHTGFKLERTTSYALAPAAPIPFPDANLRRYLVEQFDKDGDNQISVAESAVITRIDVCTDHVVSLSGIEFLEKLKELRCCGSESGSGRLESLDVSGNPLLEVLHCYGNPSLTKIWLKTGQTIGDFLYDSSVSTLNYK